MPRHQHKRTWRHIAQDFNITITAGPDTAVFTSVTAVEDNADGLEIKHLNHMMSLGTFNTTPPTVMADFNSGLYGYFLWPVDAATPTVSTINLEESSKVFGRRIWITQHDIPRMFSAKWPKVFIKSGLELFHFVIMLRQSGAAADVSGTVQGTFVRTTV